MGRKAIRRLLDERKRATRLERYNRMASKIQACWKGYSSRRSIFDFYKRKAYIQSVVAKGEETRRMLKEYESRQTAAHEQATIETLKRHQSKIAERLHHLLSTKAVPGVLARDLPPRVPYPKHVQFYDHRPEFKPTAQSPRASKLPERSPTRTSQSLTLPLLPTGATVTRPFGDLTASLGGSFDYRSMSDDLLYSEELFRKRKDVLTIDEEDIAIMRLAESSQYDGKLAHQDCDRGKSGPWLREEVLKENGQEYARRSVGKNLKNVSIRPVRPEEMTSVPFNWRS
ncbi:hypothetical protein RI367_003732 [Sorochytrium milnesiophthora]